VIQFFGVILKVLIKCPPTPHIEKLGSATDAEHWFSGRHRCVEHSEFGGVAGPTWFSGSGVSRLVIKRGVHVRAAAYDEPIQPGKCFQDRVGPGRNQKRRASSFRHRISIDRGQHVSVPVPIGPLSSLPVRRDSYDGTASDTGAAHA
jgi:hypothetical protein